MKLYKFLSIAVLVGALTSCNDWLDGVENKSSVDDAAVFNTEETIDQYVDGFYTWIGTYGQLNMDNRQFSGSWTEAMTDIFKYSGSFLFARAGHPNEYAEQAVPMNPDSDRLSCWDNAYSAIRRVNQFLTLEEKYAGGYREELRTRWQAQARFFRAFMYFQLAKRHGGVILFDALPDGPNKARSTEEETWNFIEKDLDFAIANLPKTWTGANKGRISKYAAFAFKSRAMLYAERWQKAYDAADSVIVHGGYGLVENYAQAWAGNNSEAIIECDYNQNLGPNTQFDFYYTPSTDGSTGACGPAPTQELVESSEKVDGTKIDWTPWHGTTTTPPPYDQLEPRFSATVLYPGCTWKGKTLDMSVQGPNVTYFDYGTQPQAQGNTCTGYLVRKLLNENMTDVVNVRSAQPWVELRYAEVLLNKAEAAYRLDKMGEARSAINEVRARVNLPAKNSTGTGLWNDYMNERKIELAFEGHLYWDMVRWRLAHTAYNNYRRHGVKVSNGTYTYVVVDNVDLKYSEKCYILPIPQSEINNNNLIVQYDNWK